MSTESRSTDRQPVIPVPTELADARIAVGVAAREATRRARSRAVEQAEAAQGRAAAEVACLRGAIEHASRAADGRDADPGPRAVPVGVARVRRHTRATADVDVPVLVPIGPQGGACVVGGEAEMPEVLALLEATVLAATSEGVLPDAPVVVVNPRGRRLPPAVAALPGLRTARDARPAVAAALQMRAAAAGTGSGSEGDAAPGAGAATQDRSADGHGAGPTLLVVLDFPHGLGLSGRRLVQAAARGDAGIPWALLIHVAADGPDVDMEHRRFRDPRCGVPMPAARCELWAARGRWMWTQHPGVVVHLARRGAGAGPRGEVGDARALPTYAAALDGLVRAARRLDEELAAVRREERLALDEVARRRRHALDALLHAPREGGRRGTRESSRADGDRGPPVSRWSTLPGAYGVGPGFRRGPPEHAYGTFV